MKNKGKLVCSSLFVSLLTPGTGHATPLANLFPSLSEVQLPVAVAIDQICPKLRNYQLVPDARGTSVGNHFFYSCSAIVQTSAGTGPLNLNISQNDLAQLLKDIAPTQINAQAGGATSRTSTSLLGARLFDLRQGTRGLSFSVNGVDVPAVASAGMTGERGGGASSDTALGTRWSGYVKVSGNWGNVDQTEREAAYKYDAFSMLAGADYRLTDAFVLGGALSYDESRSRFDNDLGRVDSKTWSIMGYGMYTSGPWYFDGYLAYGSIDYDTKRTILIESRNASEQTPTLLGHATASPNGDQWTFAVGTGYNYALGGYTLTPAARLAYINVHNKAFSEDEPITGMGLAIGRQTLESLQSSFGATIATTVNTSIGVLAPYFTASWIHEFKNGAPSITAKFVNDPTGNPAFFIPMERPTRDYGVFILGSSATLPQGFSGFLQVGAAAGLRNATNYNVVLGVRKEL